MEKHRCYNCMEEMDLSISPLCPHCGYNQEEPKEQPYYLDPETVIDDKYVIGRAIACGGYGIVYVAWDKHLMKKIAIKEFFPQDCATRLDGTCEVCALDGEKSYQFEEGLRFTADEACKLAKLSHLEGVVHVKDSLIYNCTVYLIMEFIDGITLKEIIMNDGCIPYEKATRTVMPVLKSLDEVHKNGIIHRDIAPDNIIRTDDGKLKLIDFGAAVRSVSSEKPVIMKPGFAPIEQYSADGVQGPYTDVYAFAAVLYYMITGKTPTPSDKRLQGEELKTFAELGIDVPEEFENILMYALTVEPSYRVQTAGELYEMLHEVVGDEEVSEEPIIRPEKEPFRLSKKWKIAIAASVFIAVSIIVLIFTVNSNNSVSDGFVVPSFKGMSENEVFKEVEELGLKDSQVDINKFPDANKDNDGKVIRQDVEAGSKIEDSKKSQFRMTITIGVYDKDAGILAEKKIEVPDLKGMTVKQAERLLKDKGFMKYSADKDRVYSNEYDEGLICGQSVKPGKTVSADTKISYSVSKGERPTTTRPVITTSPPTRAPSTTAPTTKAPTTEAKVPTTNAVTIDEPDWQDGDYEFDDNLDDVINNEDF